MATQATEAKLLAAIASLVLVGGMRANSRAMSGLKPPEAPTPVTYQEPQAIQLEGPIETLEPIALEPIEARHCDCKITSGVGLRRNPLTGQSERHEGIDVSMPVGSPLYAFDDGKVIATGQSASAGRYLKVSHEGRTVTYMHLSRIAVGVGDLVATGEMIANSGASGHVTGPHLHLETTIRGVVVDPTPILNRVVNPTYQE